MGVEVRVVYRVRIIGSGCRGRGESGGGVGSGEWALVFWVGIVSICRYRMQAVDENPVR